MNIYFACSITGGREFERVYQHLTAALLADGHTLPTAYLAQPSAVTTEANISPREVYERDISWIQNTDALIAEVSVPSHGVGYEIGFALNEGKPVLCLCQDGRKLSKMISGNSHPALAVKYYKDADKAIDLARQFVMSIVTDQE
ncbi:MAG TPA: nucleoside 2-deoxyribosyltransferase [Anaerolineales bacterium]|jgi:nucleoside 2-deoxyribosyltransferase|nr:nucleoside 2-deoxyribosyltransferase [Anaerolineales bacterium]